MSPVGSNTNAVPTASFITCRRDSWSAFTNTTAGSHLAARSAKLVGVPVGPSGTGGGARGGVYEAMGTAPEGKPELVPVEPPSRVLQAPSATATRPSAKTSGRELTGFRATLRRNAGANP